MSEDYPCSQSPCFSCSIAVECSTLSWSDYWYITLSWMGKAPQLITTRLDALNDSLPARYINCKTLYTMQYNEIASIQSNTIQYHTISCNIPEIQPVELGPGDIWDQIWSLGPDLHLGRAAQFFYLMLVKNILTCLSVDQIQIKEER